MSKISFNNTDNSFSIALRRKVDEYFVSSGMKFTGNKKLHIKTIILLTVAVSSYLILLLANPGVWISLALCALMGLNFAAIGFNIMHDGLHGSYSTKKWVNELMGYSLNMMGGCAFFWKQKHNINHHTFTNIEGHDEDMDIRPWIRTSTSQPKYWFHRYQHYYSLFLYGLSYISWVLSKDFTKYFSGKIGNTKIKNMTLKEHVIFWISKFVYIFLFIALPIMTVGFIPTLIGYGVLSFVCGIVLSIIFQMAHLVEDTHFPVPEKETQTMENEWMIHQLSTTANFATRNKVVSWFVGGLNYQVEHHLFPRISHIHYPAISKLVKEVCQSYQVKYIEYPTVFQAFRSHLLHLKAVGASV